MIKDACQCEPNFPLYKHCTTHHDHDHQHQSHSIRALSPSTWISIFIYSTQISCSWQKSHFPLDSFTNWNCGNTMDSVCCHFDKPSVSDGCWTFLSLWVWVFILQAPIIESTIMPPCPCNVDKHVWRIGLTNQSLVGLEPYPGTRFHKHVTVKQTLSRFHTENDARHRCFTIYLLIFTALWISMVWNDIL